jgi:hypothetical protein
MAGLEITPPINSTMVCHLNYPGSSRPSRRIETPALTVKEEKDFLKQIVSFCLVPENAIGDYMDQASIALEKQRERFSASLPHLC